MLFLLLLLLLLFSPNDWIYAEAELKRRLGSNFLIYGTNLDANCYLARTEGFVLVPVKLSTGVAYIHISWY